jgi:DNA-3-methyladenine glycosylase II
MHGIGGDEPPVRVWKGSVAHLKAIDPVLAKIIDKLGGKAPMVAMIHDPFEALVRTILHQSVRAAQSTKRVEALKALFEGRFPRPSQILTINHQKLRGIGLSTLQAKAVYNLAKAVYNRKVNLGALSRMGDEDVLMELTKLEGVGEWSAQMVLAFHLGRPDVWMSRDTSLCNAVAKVYNLGRAPTPAEMDAMSGKWKPYRSAAAWYLWKEGGGFSPGLQ